MHKPYANRGGLVCNRFRRALEKVAKYLEVSVILPIFATSNNKESNMKLTKEEALKRFKNALDRKKAWEEKFEAKYADE